MVYHHCTLPFLASLGILDDCLARGLAGEGLTMRRFSNGDVVHMSLGVLDGLVEHPYNLHLGQGDLGRIVLEHLQRHPGASVVWNAEFGGLAQDTDGVTVRFTTADGPAEIRAGWVVGADGARSRVRDALGLEFPGMTWAERFVATNLRYDFGKHGYGTANMVVDPTHGAIVAQIDADGLWRCTFSEDESLPVESVPERIRVFLAEFLPDDDGYELVHHAPYRMHQRVADRMRVGRVLLAGDAAHATNPTGGMGLTSGLFDAETLHEALAAVVHGSVVDTVLDRYDECRRKAFLEVASPRATQLKQLVYSTRDPAVLDGAFADLHATANDPDRTRGRFLATGAARTGSVLDVPATA